MNIVKSLGPRSAALAAFLAAFLTMVGLVPRQAGAVVVVRTAVNYRPVARPAVGTAVVAGAAVATAAAVGSVAHTLPPSCRSVVVGNVAYQECGNVWYQPRYAGSQVTYVVVNPPR